MTDVLERADAKKPYGDVAYADPGYQKDGKKRYPLTADKVKAAWSYINQPDNAKLYTPAQLKAIKGRIRAAMVKFGHTVADMPQQSNSRPADLMCVRAFEFESRSSDDGRTLEGYAAVFNQAARIQDMQGEFDEVILPGAFTRSLERRTPVLQFEHGRDPRVGAKLLAGILTNVLANQYALGLTAIERPVPAAGRGGLVCAHCGFASAHERAFYCPKCGMRLLRG